MLKAFLSALRRLPGTEHGGKLVPAAPLNLGRTVPLVTGQRLAVLANRRSHALAVLEAAGINPEGILIATSPDDLRGRAQVLDVRRIGKRFSPGQEAQLEELEAAGRICVTYGL